MWMSPHYRWVHALLEEHQGGTGAVAIERTARCSCGALSIRCRGEPVRRSICHCEACRRRTGSAFSFNITFEADQVEPRGEARTYTRKADSGLGCTYSFCPTCGATVFYAIAIRPGKVSVPMGAFASLNEFEPDISVYTARQEGWLAFRPSHPIREE